RSSSSIEPTALPREPFDSAPRLERTQPSASETPQATRLHIRYLPERRKCCGPLARPPTSKQVPWLCFPKQTPRRLLASRSSLTRTAASSPEKLAFLRSRPARLSGFMPRL